MEKEQTSDWLERRRESNRKAARKLRAKRQALADAFYKEYSDVKVANDAFKEEIVRLHKEREDLIKAVSSVGLKPELAPLPDLEENVLRSLGLSGQSDIREDMKPVVDPSGHLEDREYVNALASDLKWREGALSQEQADGEKLESDVPNFRSQSEPQPSTSKVENVYTEQSSWDKYDDRIDWSSSDEFDSELDTDKEGKVSKTSPSAVKKKCSKVQDAFKDDDIKEIIYNKQRTEDYTSTDAKKVEVNVTESHNTQTKNEKTQSEQAETDQSTSAISGNRDVIDTQNVDKTLMDAPESGKSKSTEDCAIQPESSEEKPESDESTKDEWKDESTKDGRSPTDVNMRPIPIIIVKPPEETDQQDAVKPENVQATDSASTSTSALSKRLKEEIDKELDMEIAETSPKENEEVWDDDGSDDQEDEFTPSDCYPFKNTGTLPQVEQRTLSTLRSFLHRKHSPSSASATASAAECSATDGTEGTTTNPTAQSQAEQMRKLDMLLRDSKGHSLKSAAYTHPLSYAQSRMRPSLKRQWSEDSLAKGRSHSHQIELSSPSQSSRPPFPASVSDFPLRKFPFLHRSISTSHVAATYTPMALTPTTPVPDDQNPGPVDMRTRIRRDGSISEGNSPIDGSSKLLTEGSSEEWTKAHNAITNKSPDEDSASREARSKSFHSGISTLLQAASMSFDEEHRKPEVKRAKIMTSGHERPSVISARGVMSLPSTPTTHGGSPPERSGNLARGVSTGSLTPDGASGSLTGGSTKAARPTSIALKPLESPQGSSAYDKGYQACLSLYKEKQKQLQELKKMQQAEKEDASAYKKGYQACLEYFKNKPAMTPEHVLKAFPGVIPGRGGSLPGTPLGALAGTPLGSLPGTPLSALAGTPLGNLPGTPLVNLLNRLPGTPLGQVRSLGGTPQKDVQSPIVILPPSPMAPMGSPMVPLNIRPPFYPNPALLRSPTGLVSPGHVGSPVRTVHPAQILSPRHILSPGYVSSPGHVRSPGHILSPGYAGSPVHLRSPSHLPSPSRTVVTGFPGPGSRTTGFPGPSSLAREEPPPKVQVMSPTAEMRGPSEAVGPKPKPAHIPVLSSLPKGAITPERPPSLFIPKTAPNLHFSEVLDSPLLQLATAAITQARQIVPAKEPPAQESVSPRDPPARTPVTPERMSARDERPSVTSTESYIDSDTSRSPTYSIAHGDRCLQIDESSSSRELPNLAVFDNASESSFNEDQRDCEIVPQIYYRHRRDKNNMASRRSREKRRIRDQQIEQECSELEERNQRLRVKLEELQREKDIFIQTVSGTLYKTKGGLDLPIPLPPMRPSVTPATSYRTATSTVSSAKVQSSDGEDEHDTSFDSSSHINSSQETNRSRGSYGRQFSNSSFNSESSYGSSGAMAEDSENIAQEMQSGQSSQEELHDSRHNSRGPTMTGQPSEVSDKSPQRTGSEEPSSALMTEGPVQVTGNQLTAGAPPPRPSSASSTRSDSFVTLEEFAALTQRLHEAESQLQAAQRTSMAATSSAGGDGVTSTAIPAKVLLNRTGGMSTLLPSSIVKTEVKTEIKTEPEEAIVINSDSEGEHIQRPSKPSTPGPLNVNVNVNLNFQDVPGLELLMSRGRAASTSSQPDDGYEDIDTNEIPFSLEQIANASSTQLKAMIENSGLTEYQQNIVRLVRRRIQNKIAAQTARRRKMDYLNSLRTEVYELRQRRGHLVQEKDVLSTQLTHTSQSYNNLYEEVFTKMTDDHGRPYSRNEFKLEVSPVGVVLVRKDPNTSAQSTVSKSSSEPEKS